MATLQIMWMLILSLSTCLKSQAKMLGQASTSWSYNYSATTYQEYDMVTPHGPLLSPSQEERQGIQRSSACEYGNESSASDDTLPCPLLAITSDASSLPREEIHKKYMKMLERQKTVEYSMISAAEASLGLMLAAVVREQLRDCDLVLANDSTDNESVMLLLLLSLNNVRQVVHVNTIQALTRIIWKSSKCRGYFFLLDNLEPLLTFARTYHDTWDYSGRFGLVVPSMQHLEEFIASYIGEKTEHVVGVLKSSTEGEWLLYMNQLYWGPGMRHINSWYNSRFTRQLNLFPDKLSDFQGAVLKVSTFNYEPCNIFQRAENGTVVLRYGVDIEVIRAVARVLNITLEFTETQNEETWGEKHENGSWYGLMGQLDRHEVDIGLANLFVTNHWLQVIELTAPYRTERMCFMTRTEPPLPHWQALAFPYHKWTWLAIALGLVVFGPFLYLLARLSDKCGGEKKNLQDLSFSWYYAFGLHFCEAHTTIPRNTSTRIFVLFLWLYTMILTIVYSTNLMSFLLVKKQPTMMETYQDLYESGLELAGLTELYKPELAMSSNPYLQGLARVFQYYDSQDKVYAPVLEGKSVYLVGCMTLDYLQQNIFTTRGVSRVRIMKENYGSYNVALGLQRYSPLKRKFDQIMVRIQQSGLVTKFLTDTLRLDASLEREDNVDKDSGSDQETRAEGVIPLSLDHMQGLFLIICFGLLISFFSFLIERNIVLV